MTQAISWITEDEAANHEKSRESLAASRKAGDAVPKPPGEAAIEEEGEFSDWMDQTFGAIVDDPSVPEFIDLETEEFGSSDPPADVEILAKLEDAFPDEDAVEPTPPPAPSPAPAEEELLADVVFEMPSERQADEPDEAEPVQPLTPSFEPVAESSEEPPTRALEATPGASCGIPEEFIVVDRPEPAADAVADEVSRLSLAATFEAPETLGVFDDGDEDLSHEARDVVTILEPRQEALMTVAEPVPRSPRWTVIALTIAVCVGVLIGASLVIGYFVGRGTVPAPPPRVRPAAASASTAANRPPVSPDAGQGTVVPSGQKAFVAAGPIVLALARASAAPASRPIDPVADDETTSSPVEKPRTATETRAAPAATVGPAALEPEARPSPSVSSAVEATLPAPFAGGETSSAPSTPKLSSTDPVTRGPVPPRLFALPTPDVPAVTSPDPGEVAATPETLFDVPPTLNRSSRVEPTYPVGAQRIGKSGRVVLTAQIGVDGSVGQIEVVEDSAPRLGFRKTAIDAVRHWRYEPATKNGSPVAAPVTITIRFDPR